jgi:hypothetical protein
MLDGDFNQFQRSLVADLGRRSRFMRADRGNYGQGQTFRSMIRSDDLARVMARTEDDDRNPFG